MLTTSFYGFLIVLVSVVVAVGALMLAQRLMGRPLDPPPPTTALGGILTHLGCKQPSYQPSNITWTHLPPLEGAPRRLKKRARYEVMAERALRDLEGWLASRP